MKKREKRARSRIKEPSRTVLRFKEIIKILKRMFIANSHKSYNRPNSENWGKNSLLVEISIKPIQSYAVLEIPTV